MISSKQKLCSPRKVFFFRPFTPNWLPKNVDDLGYWYLDFWFQIQKTGKCSIVLIWLQIQGILQFHLIRLKSFMTRIVWADCRNYIFIKNLHSQRAQLFAFVHTVVVDVEVANRQTLLLDTAAVTPLELFSDFLLLIFRGCYWSWRSSWDRRIGCGWFLDFGFQRFFLHIAERVGTQVDRGEGVFWSSGSLKICGRVGDCRHRHELLVEVNLVRKGAVIHLYIWCPYQRLLQGSWLLRVRAARDSC